jgi:S1-C subfamily serine protease
MTPFRSVVTTWVAIVVTLSLAACAGSSTKTETVTKAAATVAAPPTGSANLQTNFVDVIDRVSPQVVQISTSQGLGSGVVMDGKGDIVTNAHVVGSGGPYTVTDSRGRSYPGTLVGSFTADDVAVVRAQGLSLPAATFANSRDVHVGDIVLAIGNPLGLRSSVTDGIISALGRTVDEPDGAVLPNVIQTSAAINPGNSGGALVNLEGAVVGVPTLAATDPELGGAAAGIGFAIPSSLVSNIATQIVAHGHVVDSHRAFLGAKLATGLISGAVVVSVQPGGPAARAGIIPGDVITSIDGQGITSPSDLAEVLATLKPGQTVTVGVVKANGSSATVRVTLGQYPGSST